LKIKPKKEHKMKTIKRLSLAAVCWAFLCPSIAFSGTHGPYDIKDSIPLPDGPIGQFKPDREGPYEATSFGDDCTQQPSSEGDEAWNDYRPMEALFELPQPPKPKDKDSGTAPPSDDRCFPVGNYRLMTPNEYLALVDSYGVSVAESFVNVAHDWDGYYGYGGNPPPKFQDPRDGVFVENEPSEPQKPQPYAAVMLPEESCPLPGPEYGKEIGIEFCTLEDQFERARRNHQLRARRQEDREIRDFVSEKLREEKAIRRIEEEYDSEL